MGARRQGSSAERRDGSLSERGYAEVTVADIAERAGLTKRSFFNHFVDKREVLFADAEEFRRTLTDHLAALDPETDPLEAAISTLTHAGLSLASYGQVAGARRDLIASSTELQERNLVKLASLSQDLQNGLTARGATPRTARFTAQAAIAVFNAAYDDWIDHPDANFGDMMNQALDDLRTAVERTGAGQQAQGGDWATKLIGAGSDLDRLPAVRSPPLPLAIVPQIDAVDDRPSGRNRTVAGLRHTVGQIRRRRPVIRGVRRWCGRCLRAGARQQPGSSRIR